MLDKIQATFQHRIQQRSEMAQQLSSALLHAAEMIVSALLKGNKIIVAGTGRSYLNAQLFSTNLLHRYEIARPSLAAHLLQNDGLYAACLAQDKMLALLYQKQLRAIAQSGDILVLFTATKGEQNIIEALQYAETNKLNVIAFTGQNSQLIPHQASIEIQIPNNNEIHTVEEHHFCLNLLSELIDSLLFHPTNDD